MSKEDTWKEIDEEMERQGIRILSKTELGSNTYTVKLTDETAKRLQGWNIKGENKMNIADISVGTWVLLKNGSKLKCTSKDSGGLVFNDGLYIGKEALKQHVTKIYKDELPIVAGEWYVDGAGDKVYCHGKQATLTSAYYVFEYLEEAPRGLTPCLRFMLASEIVSFYKEKTDE